MSGAFLTFSIADVVGAATLWLVTRARGTYPWAWAIAAWVTAAALGMGAIPIGTMVPIAALTLVIAVGLIAPLVGLIAALTLLASPILVAQLLWGRWRRRQGVASRISHA
jgi:hypothetical protein